MRISVKTSEVFDFFANQLQSTARASNSWNQSGFSVMYENGILYSASRYNPIARWVRNQQGQEALLITSQPKEGYASTALWRARQASQHVKQINAPLVLSDSHKEQFDNFQLDFEAMIDRVKRIKRVDRLVETFEQMKVWVADYADFFGVEIPAELTAVMSMKGDTLEAIRKKIANAKKLAERADKKHLKDHLDSVQAFREGRNDWVVRYYGMTKFPEVVEHQLLRYNETNHRIETSGGVQIPYTAGKRFYQAIVRGRRDGTLQNLRGSQIMQYRVGSITDEKIFIGCHQIPWSEIELVAKELDWVNPKVLGLDS